jgi:hypothetical protein
MAKLKFNPVDIGRQKTEARQFKTHADFPVIVIE